MDPDPVNEQTKQFLKETGLTLEQATGQQDTQALVPVRWPFSLGLPLFDPEKEYEITTNLRHLHQWYLRESAKGRQGFYARFKEFHFFREPDDIWISFEEIYQLYQKDALDWTLMACWTL